LGAAGLARWRGMMGGCHPGQLGLWNRAQARKKHFELKFKVLLDLVGPAGVEPTTNGLKVLNSVPLSATLSTFFSVDKKWCASFCVVSTAGKMKTL
jgi:hypothetical protein